MTNNNLKHLFLFEAFSSKAVSKTISYIQKSLGKKEATRFINSLKKIKDIYDYPIDRLSDEFMDYMSAKDAIKIKAPEGFKSTNPWGLYCLTFWFSMEKGYLGYTGTGEYTTTYKGVSRKNIPFDRNEIEIIKNKSGISKGKLIPVTNYKDLKHLDKVVGYFCSSIDTDYLDFATIWLGHDQIYYAIQNVSSGNRPPGSMQEWQRYGRNSWGMGSFKYPSSDHLKLHKYVESDEDLHVESPQEVDEPRDYILPVRSNGRLSDWNGSYNSCDDNIIDNADFAIVLYIDDIMNPDKAEFYERPSDIRSKRMSSKEGATKFLTDDEIRQQNIERYISKMLQDYGINKSEIKLGNVNSLILKCIGPNPLLSCRRGHINDISRFSDKLYRMMRCISEGYSKSEIESFYSNLVDIMEDIHNKFINRTKNYKETIDIVKNELNQIVNDSDSSESEVRDANRALNIIDMIEKTGQKIYNNIQSQRVDTLEDIKILYYKLDSIRVAIEDDDTFFLDEHAYIAFSYFEDGKKYGVRNSQNYLLYLSASDRMYNMFLKSMGNIDRLIDSYFR